jgi:hypothetical protein
MFPTSRRARSHGVCKFSVLAPATWPQLVSLLCLLALVAQLVAEPVRAVADLAAPQESIHAVAVADQASYLPSSGRAEALAGLGNVRMQSGASSRLVGIEQTPEHSGSILCNLSHADRPPRLLLRHRLRSSGTGDPPA